jgi:hypothetical protein
VTVTLLASALVVLTAGDVVITSLVFAQLHRAAEARTQIRDCIEPSGQCYKDGQTRTVKAIGTIQEGIALAAACAPNFAGLPMQQRIMAIEKCIADGLGK